VLSGKRERENIFVKDANLRLHSPDRFVKTCTPLKESATARVLLELCRVVVVGDTCVSEEGMAAIVGRDKRYHVCGGAHGFYDAGELMRKHQLDVLLIEPFLEDRDGIRWIKDLATEFPRTRILIVSRQSERIYPERALRAGAAGYWMKNGSANELLRAIETVAAGKIYVSPLIAQLAVQKFAYRTGLPHEFDALSDRELAVFALIAAEQGWAALQKSSGSAAKLWRRIFTTSNKNLATRTPRNSNAAHASC
jgi:DNA-binding NarL/FixJ family response regulator